MNSEQPGCGAGEGGEEREQGASAAGFVPDDENGGAEECGDGVQVGSENVWDLAQQHVADHPAAHAGDGSQDDGLNRSEMVIEARRWRR